MQQATTPVSSPRYRTLPKGWRLVSATLPAGALVLAAMYLFGWRPFGYTLIDLAYHYLLISAFLPLGFIWVPASKNASRVGVPWYDILLSLAAFAVPIYYFYNLMQILHQGWGITPPTTAVIVGVVFWILVVEAGRRAAGPVFAVVVLVFSAYPLFGTHLPGMLWSPPYSFRFVVGVHTMGEDSIMGVVMRAFGRLLFGYMFFAVTLQLLGAGKFFNEMAVAMLGSTRAGAAKVSIVSSGFFGSVSGSAVANVLVTGAFTIPAMKKEGFPPHFAGAVEAVASSGGAIMPPVMATTGFIMAEWLGVPYGQVALAAAVPAILYYVCLFAHIDSFAAREGLKPAPVLIAVPPLWRILFNNLHILLSFALLILLLFVFRLSSWAPWLATGAAIVLAMFRKETRINLNGLLGLLELSGKVLGDLIGIIAAVGLIVGSFIMTGIALTFPNAVVGLAGGNVYLVLLFGAVSSFILGMGVSLVASYIFLALVLVPGLVTFGFDPFAAHLFVMYCAIWSYLTPPVAVAAFTASSVAGAGPMKTGFTAMKLAISIYILPFIFVLSPALILHGPISDMLVVIPTTLLALLLFSGAFEGYIWRVGSLTIAGRALFFAVGILLALPERTTDVYGVAALAGLLALFYFLRWLKSPLVRVLLKPSKLVTM